MALEPSQQGAYKEALPYFALDQLEFVHVLSGSRIASVKDNPKKFYGPVTIRNYLAGYTKKVLRLSRVKDAPESSVFLRLPVELQLLVLEHLHPLDLYHFSLVSKSFRKFILHPKALGVWKATFVRHPNLPLPPPGVKDSDWSFMIYGPGICGVCGKYGALTDFSFLKRFCGFCLKDHCFPINSFRDEFNNTIPPQHHIWTLIPKSYRSSGIRYKTDISERFLEPDFSSMWKKLTLIRLLVASGVPLLSGLYEEYEALLRDHVRSQRESAAKANIWAVDVFRQFSNEYDGITFKLTERLKNRLHGLGHDRRDIVAVSGSIRDIFREEAIYHLKRKAFREIKSRIEVLIKEAKAGRIVVERQNLLRGIYRDYLKVLPPVAWQYCPRVDGPHILEIEAFRDFLGPPFEKRGDIAPGYAATFFSDSIDKWVRTQQENIAGILPALEGVKETSETKIQRLELATSVLTCRVCNYSSHSGHALVGWKSICRHLCSSVNCYKNCQKFEVNRHAVAAATSLVSCVGLDPLITTMDDMDQRNDRFMCGSCIPEENGGRRFMRVYTWLECLEHTMEMVNMYTDVVDVMHVTPAWLLLSPAATRFVREHERPYPHRSHHIWRCNHCAQHFEKQGMQQEVLDHVKWVHCIGNPVIGADVVPDMRKNIRKRRPFRLFRDPRLEHRCKHCENLPIYKLWEKGALMAHLMKKHYIAEPVENVDLETVATISASTLGPTLAAEINT